MVRPLWPGAGIGAAALTTEKEERRIEQAKQTCHRCPVIAQCREYALRTREPYGVWGGLSEEDRAEILGVGNLRYPTPRRETSAPARVVAAVG